VRGDRTFTFVVEPARGVQIPTSAAVSVNPAQIQLLLGKIDHLNAKVQQLKEQVKETSPHIRR
jgi:outer membrane murein-binding lipoprotein Lpp